MAKFSNQFNIFYNLVSTDCFFLYKKFLYFFSGCSKPFILITYGVPSKNAFGVKFPDGLDGNGHLGSPKRFSFRHCLFNPVMVISKPDSLMMKEPFKIWMAKNLTYRTIQVKH